MAPYWISDEHPSCPRWAVVKSGFELVACHSTRERAISQMVALSEAEGIDPEGEWPDD